MAGLLLLMLFVVCCPLILSQSGDDDETDEENVTCSSSLSFNQNSLTCTLNNEPPEERTLLLCTTADKKEKCNCVNATQGPQGFTFYNLKALATYKLCSKPEHCVIKENIRLSNLVKIPAPQIQLATYMKDSEESFISIEHHHDFVKEPMFQVEVLEGKLAGKNFNTTNRNLTISKEILGEDGVYYIRVRAKPVGYFNGMWSEWSSKANFTIKTTAIARNLDPQIITYIIIIIPVGLLFIIGLMALRWRSHIKSYIKPNIPQPKATLAQIHRGKEGFPFIFSLEIFREVFIHRVDYVEEKASAAELQEGLDEHRSSQASFASVCEIDTKEAEWSPREQSHLKIGLLNDFSEEREGGGSEGVTALQRECKDEAYVTMSSLFKTQ